MPSAVCKQAGSARHVTLCDTGMCNCMTSTSQQDPRVPFYTAVTTAGTTQRHTTPRAAHVCAGHSWFKPTVPVASTHPEGSDDPTTPHLDQHGHMPLRGFTRHTAGLEVCQRCSSLSCVTVYTKHAPAGTAATAASILEHSRPMHPAVENSSWLTQAPASKHTTSAQGCL